MKIRVADFVADFLVDHGVTHCFSVVGGGSIHLNDAMGKKSGLTCVYDHHEQACAIAAEAYARIDDKIAAVCVTTGPGGVNALTGVVGGWVDSVPMLVISGQVRYDTTVKSTGLPLRALGDQEFDICSAVESMTKYCEMVTDPNEILYCLEKALYLATTGRRGPCWLDIPLNVQGAHIETNNLKHFDVNDVMPEAPDVTSSLCRDLLAHIREAERPVIYAGSAIRTAGAYDVFHTVVNELHIPVVTCWNSIDLMESDDPLYVGRGGGLGDRAGNFAVQNSDLLFSIGSRLSIRQVGYNWDTWARESFVIMNDIDRAELQKPTLHVDLPIWADCTNLLNALADELANSPITEHVHTEWLEKCRDWKRRYPVILPRHIKSEGSVNIYAFIDSLNRCMRDDEIVAVGNGSACVACSHALEIKSGTRYIVNSGMASMGYDLPAAIGVAVAEFGDDALFGNGLSSNHGVILITGDGSIQMNIQELQTVVHHKMPIKIFLFNNDGYHSIRQTQTNLFDKDFYGIGPDSGDISFPNMSKIAEAYGIAYLSCANNAELDSALKRTLDICGPVICEVFVSKFQIFEPKSATKRMDDGSLFSPPLEDLAPFLPRDEFEENMIISPIS